MADLINDFSWSKTREDCFQRCRRQYWFTYYGSWQGWDKKADPRVRTAYVLKQLKSRQMWSGEIVHRCIQWALNTLRTTGDMPAEESALHNVLRRMQRDFQESGEGLYWDKPKEHCALREHEYDEDIDDELWQAVMQHAANCVTHFYQSEILQHIRRLTAADWLEMEKLTSFMVDDIKVWVQLDFAHRNADGGITIYDWKTGKADKPATREQLASYILYAAQQWRVPTEQITACEFHLPGKKVYETKLTTADLALVQDQIRVAAGQLRELHNRPEDAFPFTEREAECSRCNFPRICPRFAESAE